MASPANLRRHFLSWDRPMLPQAVAYLAGHWAGGTPLDLTNVLVVVPTKQTGRRLREALAVHAHGYQQAVFPPHVITPDRLIVDDGAKSVATPLESLLAWAQVLGGIDLANWREVFPIDPPARNFAWALRLARQLTKLQASLAEGGLTMDRVADRAGDFPETARWRQLGDLEQLFTQRLAASGRIDAQTAKLAAVQSPKLAAGLERIVLLATPDPLPLAITAVGRLANEYPVDVVVFAPESETGQFDDWGRPRTTVWEKRVLDLPDFDARVHLCGDPLSQAEQVVTVARNYDEPEGWLAVGVADAEVLPVLESALRSVGITTFNPEGRKYRQEGFYELLSVLAELAKDPTFEVVERLARCPDFIACLAARIGGDFSSALWLAEIDALRQNHLPSTLEAAQVFASERKASADLIEGLTLMNDLQMLLARGTFSGGVVAALKKIFEQRKLQAGSAIDVVLQEAAAAWMERLRECATWDAELSGMSRTDWWELALQMFGEESRAEEKPDGAIELMGWLELLWEDAPHLMVTGFNDGNVPDAVSGDAFLPESLRVRLGLKTNSDRLARDAYILQALASSRGATGRLDLIFGKVSGAGDPLRPSRLLLRCPEEELPARVKSLFREPPTAGASVAWSRAWQLRPRAAPVPTRVAVTSLRDWLKCPFRFYLRHVLKMSPVDAAKTELDARDFGTLCHNVLELIGRNLALRDCDDEVVLKRSMLDELDRLVRKRYGMELTLPLLVQVESARQRLGKVAAIQAQQRAEGWVIIEVERKFELPVAGLVIAGRIDRIERHARNGAIRVIDYKTSDTAVTPTDAHLRSRKADESLPDWCQYTGAGKPKTWVDLQLPVYLEALAAEFGGQVTCGYFNLPKAVGETGLAMWEDYSPDLQASARKCVEGLGAAILAGEFWPPRELSGWDAELDEFAALFHHGATASVVWTEAKS